MYHKSIWLGVFGAAAAVAVGLALLVGDGDVDDPQDAATELDETAKDRLAREAAIAWIAAESGIIDASDADTPTEMGSATESMLAAATVAPPGFQQGPPLSDYEATPPAGFSFAAYHDVERAPMTDADIDREPAPAPEWMTFGDGALTDQAAAAGRDWTYGWVKLADGADLAALRASVAAQGGEVLGHAGDLVRARLPGSPTRLRAIAEAPSVAGIGAVPADRKVTDTLAARAGANAGDRVPVWITLMGDDPDGGWRRALQGFGADVGRHDPSIRTYAAVIGLDALGPIAAADFVLAVEIVGRLEPTLEIAAPAMGAAALRSYDAAAGTFTGVGGASVPIGVMDTGLNISHPDISSNRRSICGVNLSSFFDAREEDQDLWLDHQGHGTHVTGIVAGNGAVQRNRVGMAPLVQDIRIAKALSSFGTASALGWNRALDWFAKPTACGGDEVPRKALVVNSSLGYDGDVWEGRSVVERKIDASVWAARQLFVTSMGNSTGFASSSMAGAKNALSVGAAQNSGDITAFSSHGPTRDGRLNPKVVGTGFFVWSAAGRGRQNGYRISSGTSMSSPSVVGVAALVMDAVPELREEPAALRARLMASAIKPDALMGDASAFALDNTNGPGTIQNVFGLGKVSARTAVLNRDTADGWVGGSAAFDMDAGRHAYRDIVVPEGASRLDVVMTWDEPPADTITDPVLHDLDLWVDPGAACGTAAACGDYASRSRIDNVEWVVIPHPQPGVYRLKVLPNRIYGAPPRAGLAWTVIRGDSTPRLRLSAASDRIEVAPDAPFDVAVTMSTDAYVAAGANLRVDCRTAPGSTACDGVSYVATDSTVQREDALERSIERDEGEIVVGEIGPGEAQTVSLRFRGRPAGSFTLYFSASAWNADGGAASVAVVVGEPRSGDPAPVPRPPNDDFADAVRLEGAAGETIFDLIAASPDPGEPAFPLDRRFDQPFRTRSLWYVWTAPDDGLARFSIAPSVANDYADHIVVQVYRDGPMATLRALGAAQLGGGATFFADAGATYRVRLTINPLATAYIAEDEAGETVLRQVPMPPLTLRFGPGGRPDNDDYASAAVLEGDSGGVDGTNMGATSEPPEFQGNAHIGDPGDTSGWTGSVWYRWTAPASGDFRFSTNRRSVRVAAFVGEDLAAARMVSGTPRSAPDSIVFPATAGVEYRIGAATGDAYWSGADFELSWAPGERESPGNDDFASAAASDRNAASGWVAFDDMTVEHGEPAASGVRTAWWSWRATADGRHTWLVDRIATLPRDEAPMQISVFEGDELASLELVRMDDSSDGTQLHLVFDARADTLYHVALGLPRGAAQASLPPSAVSMRWGETPENDDLANAWELVGASGSVSGSSEFATIEPGEHTGAIGDASLWWAITPQDSGWIRFAVNGPQGSKLVIYRVGVDGALERVTASRQIGDTAATFRVDAGARYVIRYGLYFYDADGRGGGSPGPFELSWGPSDPPALLRYVASIPGEPTLSGVEVQFGTPGNQAFNADGTELYVASADGLIVFGRDPATGKLTLMETLADYPVTDPDTELLWDEAGAALLVASCERWLKFTPRDGGGIEPAGEIDGAPCPVERLLIGGDFVHHVMKPWMIETYRFDADHTALSSVDLNMIPDVSNAVMTADGTNVYALTQDRGEYALVAAERDPDTGRLRISTILEEGSATPGAVVEGLTDVRMMAVRGSHLFLSAGVTGADTLVFDLADRAYPAFAGSRSSFVGEDAECEHTLARHDARAVDVACTWALFTPSQTDEGTNGQLFGTNGQLFTVQVAPDGAPLGADRVIMSGNATDAFGTDVPSIEDLVSVAGSPDGRHLYVAGSLLYYSVDPNDPSEFVLNQSGQLHVFERVYEVAEDVAEH